MYMSWAIRSSSAEEDSWEPLEQQGYQSSKSWRKSILNIHWKDWCWSWSWHLNTLASWCEELTYYKRPWFWERWKAGAERDNRGQDGWMTSPTQWTWVWASSGRWWRIGNPGVLQYMGLQRAGHNWVTEQINQLFAHFHCATTVNSLSLTMWAQENSTTQCRGGWGADSWHLLKNEGKDVLPLLSTLPLIMKL